MEHLVAVHRHAEAGRWTQTEEQVGRWGQRETNRDTNKQETHTLLYPWHMHTVGACVCHSGDNVYGLFKAILVGWIYSPAVPHFHEKGQGKNSKCCVFLITLIFCLLRLFVCVCVFPFSAAWILCLCDQDFKYLVWLDKRKLELKGHVGQFCLVSKNYK